MTARDVIVKVLIGNGERNDLAGIIADNIIEALKDVGYIIIRDRTDPEGGIPGRQP